MPRKRRRGRSAPRQPQVRFGAILLSVAAGPSGDTARAMKTVRDWLNEYAVSHQNPVNKTVHWICVPVITFTVLGLLRAIPGGNDLINACTIGGALALAYY